MTAADAGHAPPAITHLSADEIRLLDPYGFLAVPATAAERQPRPRSSTRSMPAGCVHEVKAKYREVAEDPTVDFHFHTGRAHARRLGYPLSPLDQLPEAACEAFAGVANPFHWDHPQPGEYVVDLGSGAGMDAFLASLWVGPTGRVIGVDMTPEMLTRSRRLADQLELENVEFREGVIEDLPVEDGWADVVISNGVINLCPDKVGVYREIHRVLRPGGRMRIADICVQRPVPEGALRDIDLWTG